MPELQITDGQGRLNFGSRSHVFARMLFPNDEDRRIDYETLLVAQYLWSQYENDEDEVRGLRKVVLGNLILGPSPREFEDSLRTASFWGETVGDLVLTVMLLKKEIGPEASLNKAIKVIQHRAVLLDEENGHSQLRSVSAIKKHWKELKQVAHLWAAYVLTGLPRWDQEVEGLKPVHFATEEDFEALLDLAEYTLAWGAKHISKRQGPRATPLLDSATAWRVPSDLVLRPPTDYRVGFEPLSPEEVQVALSPKK